MEVILKDLSLSIGNRSTVSHLNLTIPNGQLVTILGPDGGGKSITLMILAGLYKPTDGSIYIGKNDVTDWEREHREVEIVSKCPSLFVRKSVIKNIIYPLRIRKVPKREAMKLAMEMAELFQIDHLLNQKPFQLTDDQKSRVAIARAVVTCPKVLLLDEPHAFLDTNTQKSLLRDIRRIQQKVRITTVLVTNHQEEVLSISDKVLLMKDGIPQHYSPPGHLTDDYAPLMI